MKRISEKNFREAWGGIASLSLALPLMWTEVTRRGFTLLDLAGWMAESRPGGRVAVRARVEIAAGSDADFVVFDSEREFVVAKESLYYRHPVSPYLEKPCAEL